MRHCCRNLSVSRPLMRAKKIAPKRLCFKAPCISLSVVKARRRLRLQSRTRYYILLKHSHICLNNTILMPCFSVAGLLLLRSSSSCENWCCVSYSRGLRHSPFLEALRVSQALNNTVEFQRLQPKDVKSSRVQSKRGQIYLLWPQMTSLRLLRLLSQYIMEDNLRFPPMSHTTSISNSLQTGNLVI